MEVVGRSPEEMARFPGGLKELFKYMNENLSSKITLSEEELNMYVMPYTHFSIDEKGYVDSVKIIRSSNIPYVDALFLEALLKMPKWIPSKLRGKPKRQEFNLPLTICFK